MNFLTSLNVKEMINFHVLLLVSSSVQCSGATVHPRTAAVGDFIDPSFSNKEPLKISAIRGQPGFSFEL